jgi:hypothetical protein
MREKFVAILSPRTTRPPRDARARSHTLAGPPSHRGIARMRSDKYLLSSYPRRPSSGRDSLLLPRTEQRSRWRVTFAFRKRDVRETNSAAATARNAMTFQLERRVTLRLNQRLAAEEVILWTRRSAALLPIRRSPSGSPWRSPCSFPETQAPQGIGCGPLGSK